MTPPWMRYGPSTWIYEMVLQRADRADVQVIVDTYTGHDIEDGETVDAEIVYEPGEEPFEPMSGDGDE